MHHLRLCQIPECLDELDRPILHDRHQSSSSSFWVQQVLSAGEKRNKFLFIICLFAPNSCLLHQEFTYFAEQKTKGIDPDGRIEECDQ